MQGIRNLAGHKIEYYKVVIFSFFCEFSFKKSDKIISVLTEPQFKFWTENNRDIMFKKISAY